MTEKVWRYKYKDTIKKTIDTDSAVLLVSHTEETFMTAEHHPGWNAPIVYDKDGITCYIYTDIPKALVEGDKTGEEELIEDVESFIEWCDKDMLELVGENVILGD